MSLSDATKEKLKRAKELRGANPELQARQKENNRIQRAILEAALEPISVPELAEKTSIAIDIVFWHVNALRKYDKMVDVKKSGDYWLYKKK